MLNGNFIPQKLKTAGTPSSKSSDLLVIVPEDHNIVLNFKDDFLNNDHAALLKRYREKLSLPSSPLIPEIQRSRKLLQIMTKDDKTLWDLITTLIMKMGRPLGIYGSFMKSYENNVQARDELLFLDDNLLVPAAARKACSSRLDESHPGQFGMKFLAESIWWPHIYIEIYHHGKSCRQCLEAGKNFQVLLGSYHVSKLRVLSFANEEMILDFASPSGAFLGSKKYIALYKDRFTNFPYANVVNNTSSISVISLLND